jgi:hypothetical protein
LEVVVKVVEEVERVLWEMGGKPHLNP